MKIITATGTEYQANWFGISSIDGVFRANLKDIDMHTAFSVFSNANETQTITLVRDTMTQPQELAGYTLLKSVSNDPDGVTIGLGRG